MSGLLDLLGWTAPITTYLVFVAPVPTLYACIKKGTMDQLSPMPFFAGFLCGALWLKYGLLIKEPTVVNVNVIGTTLQVIFMIVYLVYCRQKASYLSKLFVVLAFYAAVFYFASGSEGDPDPSVVSALGTVCAVVNIIAIGSPLAGLKDVIDTKSTENMPFPLIAVGFFCTIQWFMFGLLIKDVYMTVPNGLGIVLGIAQLSLFVIYPSRNSEKKVE